MAYSRAYYIQCYILMRIIVGDLNVDLFEQTSIWSEEMACSVYIHCTNIYMLFSLHSFKFQTHVWIYSSIYTIVRMRKKCYSADGPADFSRRLMCYCHRWLLSLVVPFFVLIRSNTPYSTKKKKISSEFGLFLSHSYTYIHSLTIAQRTVELT